jgi:hypothetical protein
MTVARPCADPPAPEPGHASLRHRTKARITAQFTTAHTPMGELSGGSVASLTSGLELRSEARDGLIGQEWAVEDEQERASTRRPDRA